MSDNTIELKDIAKELEGIADEATLNKFKASLDAVSKGAFQAFYNVVYATGYADGLVHRLAKLKEQDDDQKNNRS